jgi:hypothetical protein
MNCYTTLKTLLLDYEVIEELCRTESGDLGGEGATFATEEEEDFVLAWLDKSWGACPPSSHPLLSFSADRTVLPCVDKSPPPSLYIYTSFPYPTFPCGRTSY